MLWMVISYCDVMRKNFRPTTRNSTTSYRQLYFAHNSTDSVRKSGTVLLIQRTTIISKQPESVFPASSSTHHCEGSITSRVAKLLCSSNKGREVRASQSTADLETNNFEFHGDTATTCGYLVLKLREYGTEGC
jgi:hypothetical protein